MAYISVYVLKGCVFPRMFHCPVSNDKQVERRLRQRHGGTFSKCNLCSSNIYSTLLVLQIQYMSVMCITNLVS